MNKLVTDVSVLETNPLSIWQLFGTLADHAPERSLLLPRLMSL
ncbi:hypothetical protein [Nostoc sp.]